MKENKQYIIVFKDGLELSVVQRVSAKEKFYIDPNSIPDAVEGLIEKCLSLGALKFQKLCVELQKIRKQQIIDIK